MQRIPHGNLDVNRITVMPSQPNIICTSCDAPEVRLLELLVLLLWSYVMLCYAAKLCAAAFSLSSARESTYAGNMLQIQQGPQTGSAQPRAQLAAVLMQSQAATGCNTLPPCCCCWLLLPPGVPL